MYFVFLFLFVSLLFWSFLFCLVGWLVFSKIVLYTMKKGAVLLDIFKHFILCNKR